MQKGLVLIVSFRHLLFPLGICHSFYINICAQLKKGKKLSFGILGV